MARAISFFWFVRLEGAASIQSSASRIDICTTSPTCRSWPGPPLAGPILTASASGFSLCPPQALQGRLFW
jgi:hypothetical protein